MSKTPDKKRRTLPKEREGEYISQRKEMKEQQSKP